MSSPAPESTASGQQDAQRGLTALLTRDLAGAWLLLDRADLRGSLPKVTAAVTALVHRYGQASATLAARSYRAQRAAAGVRAPFTVPLAHPAPVGQVDASVRWATRSLWDAPTPVEQLRAQAPTSAQRNAEALDRWVAEVQAREERDRAEQEQAARTLLEGAAQRLVADAGRSTIRGAVAADRHAKGWARVPEAGACSFCLMLATRGAVYKSEGTAGRDASSRFVGEGAFKFHDHCHCTVEPVFSDSWEPDQRVQDAQALWEESTAGRSGNAARIAFRRAVEGRAQH